MNRPIIIIAEFPRCDKSGKLVPAGVPVAQVVRRMHWWEYLAYKVKLRCRRKAPKINTDISYTGISVGIRISKQGYDCITGRRQPIAERLFNEDAYEFEFVAPMNEGLTV